MTKDYHQRRDLMLRCLEETGFLALSPEGAYYVLADYTQIPILQASLKAQQFFEWLTRQIGVAVVAGNSFYPLPGHGEQSVRFAFPKRLETLHEAGKRLSKMQNYA